MPEWTSEQLDAIGCVDKGVIVPAAAGSGKTAVLIERTVRLLADKNADVPAENLMAVTFSRDAAEQIRTKLRTALADRITSETDPDTRAWLSRQQEMLPLAKISTINAFCLGLVRDNLAATDYRTGLRICDDTQAAAIINEAMNEVFESYCGAAPERYEQLIDAFTDGNEDSLAARVKQLYDFRRSLAFPDKWTADTAAQLGSEEYFTELLADLLRRLKALFDKADAAFRLEEAAITAMPKKTPTLEKTFCKDSDIVDSLKKAFVTEGDVYTRYKAIFKAARGVKFGQMRFSTKTDAAHAEKQLETVAAAGAARKTVTECIKKLKEAVLAAGPSPKKYMAVSAELFSALTELTVMLEKAVDEKKTDGGLAEFGDIERRAMNLLVTPDENGCPQRTELARTIREQRVFRVMLIDEYQDVNNLEEQIFRAVSDTDDLSVLGKNVFVVGDAKQSIYKFRQANPLLFREAIINARRPEIEGLCEIRLTRNFRSRKNILDFVNMLFVRLMSKDFGDVDYDEGERLRYGANYIGGDPPVTLLINPAHDNAEEEDSEDGGFTPLKYVNFGEEELGIALKIKQMLADGVPVSDGGTLRPCRNSDFCVLSRNNGGCDRMSAALNYVGLRAESERAKGYMGSREIVIMINLLRVIDNRMNDGALASVMLSPIMCFSTAELARLRLYCFGSDGDSQRKHLAQIISAASKTEEDKLKGAEVIELSDPALTEKCRSAQSFLDLCSYLALSLTLEELISRIYEETDIFAAASSAENAAQRRANLRLLTRHAAEYERDATGGISGFLHYLDGVAAAKMDFDQAVTVTAGSDAVSVKTFHRSKGLEYPFVFLTMLGKRFNKRDIYSPLLLSEQYGAGIKYKRHEKLATIGTLAHTALAGHILREQLSEELRLLYVALTRAKEHLFIPLSVDPEVIEKRAAEIIESGGITPDIAADCKCYLEWITCAMLLTDKRGVFLSGVGIDGAEEKLKALSPADDEPAVIEIHELDIGTADEASDENAADEYPLEDLPPQPDPDTVEELIGRYAFRFSDDETRSPAKRSVTELVHEVRIRDEGIPESTFFPQLGKLEDEEARLTGAQRGTCTHLFMQHADYDRAETDAAAELKRLTETGRFTAKEASGVYIDKVREFFKSDLYRRMKRSGKLRREMKFMIKMSDARLGERYKGLISPNGMIQGVCDCVFEEEDGFVLVDYKTDNFDAEADLDKYYIQLELYKAALDLILPMPVKACCIYSFKLGVSRTIDI
ncbi:MAG: UvrD-helicase domain-containing protein [Ruminococcus sp.]|nr:UvrD-helicase domain-containing protein [Ruminococcus sp.]